MAVEVIMPALEMAQETGKVIAWRKNEGEPVAKGEVLLEVETDKATVEIEAPSEGFLAGIRATEGAVVPVGQIIAWIVQRGEPLPTEAAAKASSHQAAPVSAVRPAARAAFAAEPAPDRNVRVSPKARRLARELGVDIKHLRGSGPGGELLAADVIAAASSNAPSATPAPTQAPVAKAEASADAETLERPSAVGLLMAERTTQTWTTVPHFFVVRETDAGALLAAREKFQATRAAQSATRTTLTDFLVAFVARILPKHPRLNASWTPEGIQCHPEANIGVAVAVNDGVVAVVIPDADRMPLEQIAARRKDLAERAKTGRLRPNDIRGATFTISNLGMYRVDAFTAIIASPQAAILAVGSVTDRVVAVDGKPEVRPMMTMTLSCDHRVVDGAHAALFLNDLSEAIARPEKSL